MRRGRPKMESGARTYQYRIRLTEEEARKLEYLSYLKDKPKSEIIRESIETSYRIAQYSN